MKGDIIIKILEIIAEEVGCVADFAVAMHNAGYGASVQKIDRELDNIQSSRERFRRLSAEEARIRKRIASCLYKLKKDGLIGNGGGGRLKSWKITALGLLRLKILRNKKEKFNLLPRKNYQKEKGDQVVLIVFDIPEKYRTKRDWLRFSIKNLGFTMLQKSVWLGKIKLPQEFIDDLKNLGLFEFVEILAISKTGTVRQIN